MDNPIDKNGQRVGVGTRVRLLSLSGKWFENMPDDEKHDVSSMIGEVFEIEQIDKYGHPWISKWFSTPSQKNSYNHSIALAAHEMEIVIEKVS